MLDELHSGMNSSAAGQEFNVNESTIILHKVSLNKNTQKRRLCVSPQNSSSNIC